MNTPPHPHRVLQYDTIVIGGGQAGLAVGHHLARQDLDFVILDGSGRVGDSWRNRWDSLRLFTPARYSGLPGMPFPDAPGHFPDKDQVADYLERYAERFDLPVRTHTRVRALRYDGTDFVLDTDDARFLARNVVVATGPFQSPRVPALAAQLRAGIHQLHSHEYRSPFALPEGDVLVVGAGNSGAQIALELARYRKVTLAGRDLGRLPRTLLGADVFRWVWPVFRRLHLDTSLGRRLRDRSRNGDPLIGITPGDFAAHGVRRVGRLTEVRGGLPVIDGDELDVRVVVWATGFAPDFRWIHLPAIAPDGTPRHDRGVAQPPGLFFVGLRFLYRQSSALLGGVGDDAAFVAAQVARRYRAGASPTPSRRGGHVGGHLRGRTVRRRRRRAEACAVPLAELAESRHGVTTQQFAHRPDRQQQGRGPTKTPATCSASRTASWPEQTSAAAPSSRAATAARSPRCRLAPCQVSAGAPSRHGI